MHGNVFCSAHDEPSKHPCQTKCPCSLLATLIYTLKLHSSATIKLKLQLPAKQLVQAPCILHSTDLPCGSKILYSKGNKT